MVVSSLISGAFFVVALRLRGWLSALAARRRLSVSRIPGAPREPGPTAVSSQAPLPADAPCGMAALDGHRLRGAVPVPVGAVCCHRVRANAAGGVEWGQ